MNRILLASVAVSMGLTSGCLLACSETPSGADDVDVAAAAPADSGRAKLHPLEKFCIRYVLEGIMQGSWEECGRDWGHTRYELQDVKMQIGAFSQNEKKRVVYREDEIFTIQADGAATRTRDTQYAQRVKAFESTDPRQVLDAFVGAMGYELTGNTRSIAGHECQEAAGPMGELCITDDALVLYLNAMGQVRRAVEVARGDSGDPANYEVPENVTEGPSLSDIEKMLKGARRP